MTTPGLRIVGPLSSPSVSTQPEPPSAFAQLKAAASQLIRDPIGTVVGMVKHVAHDLHTALFSLTPEELANPLIQARIRQLGVNPDALKPTAEANDVLRASGRTLALVAGTAAGGATGAALRATLGPTASLGGAALRGSTEALAFGATLGTLTPVEENATRAGTLLTSSVLAIPFGAVGGVTSFALSRYLRSQGIKPELDAPEVAHSTPDLDPGVAARAPRPRTMPREADLGEIPTFMRRGMEIAPERVPRTSQRASMDVRGRMQVTESTGVAPTGELVLSPIRRPVPGPMQVSLEAARGGGGRRPPPPARPPASSPEGAQRAVLDALSIGERAKQPLPTPDALYTTFFDDLHPINVATKQLLRLRRELAPGTDVVPYGTPLPGTPARLTPGVRLPGIVDPYVLARLTRGSTGKATQFLEQGPLDFATLQPVGPGLRELLAPVVTDPVALAQLRAFLVAPRALQLADRGIRTSIPLDAARRVVETTPDAVVQTALRIYDYNNALLKYVEDAGLLSAEAVAAMRAANIHYVPFFRFIEQTGEHIGPRPGASFANVQSGIRPIKGGPGKIVDPLENIVRNTYALVNIADRHFVAEALVRLAETVPDQQVVRPVGARPPTSRSTAVALREQLREAGADVSAEVAENLAAAFQPARGPEGTVWVLRNGERQYFEVDPPLYRALLQLDRESTNTLVKLLSVPASLRRAGFTAFSPKFAVRNPLRDQFSAAVFSRFGFKPGYDLLRGIFHVFGKDDLYHQFQRSGGEHAVLSRAVSADRVRTQRTLLNLMQSDSRLAWAYRQARSPKGWLEMMARLSEMNEEATRSQEFMRGLAATGDQRLAAFAARDVTIDFQRMGTAVRTANQVVEFLNAQVQDIDKIARTFGAEGGKRAASAFAQAAAYITLPSITLYLLNRDDPNYVELSQARKDIFWNIPRWRFNDEQGRFERVGFISIPKPFLQGILFGTVPERALAWLDAQDPEPFDKLAETILGAAAPPVIPGSVSVPLEVIANYDFFRNRPIISATEERLLKAEQAGPLQGETVRTIGRALNVSPRDVEHVINGYTGGLGQGALAMSDAVLRLVGVRRPVDPEERQGVRRVPILGGVVDAFLVNEPTLNSRSVERFYERYEEVTAAMATFRELARQGRGEDATAVMDGYRAEVAAYGLYQQAAAAIGELRNAIGAVRADQSASVSEREQRVLLLGRAIRTLAANANEAYRRMRIQIEAPDVPPFFGDSAGVSRVPLAAPPVREGPLAAPLPVSPAR